MRPYEVPCWFRGRMAAIMVGLIVLTGAAWDAGPPRANVVLLVVDDLGYGELGCQGNPEIPTPHIDSIAEQGIRFTNAYVTAAYCSPSRAGLMTGRYPTRFGYEFNPVGALNEDPRIGLPADQVTLAQHLRGAGYATALIGKWHLGGTAAYHPLRRGFDEFFGFLHEGHFFVPSPYDGVHTMLRRRALPDGTQGRWTSEDGRLILSTHMRHDEPAYDANNPILRAGQPVEEHEYLTDAFTREAVDFIDRHEDRPFFLYLSYNAVHSPLQAQAAYMHRFEHIEDVHRRIFAGMVANLDDSVGAVLEVLRKRKLEERTVVFFVSDNGGPTRELTSSNHPLRGGKGDLYEGGIRVPFLMQWKGTLPAGRVESRPVISLDMYATAAAAAGRPVSAKGSMDGVNLLPYLLGDDASLPHSQLYWRTGPRAALRKGDWKLVRNLRHSRADWELYNLADDVGETRNRAEAEPDILRELVGTWEQLDAEMAEPLWGGN